MFASLTHVLARLDRWPRRLAALTCLLLAAASALTGRSRERDGPSGSVPSAQVVVAARDLPAAHPLTLGDLTVATWPRRLRPAGSTAAPSRLVGRRLAGPVGAGEAITVARLVGAGLTTGLPAGTVAAAVRTDAGVADLLHPGDHVDVLAGPAGDDDAGIPPSVSSPTAAVVAQGVAVLAVLPPSADAVTGDSAARVLIATDRGTALRIVALQTRQVLAVVGDRP
jgi:pilus assembly protein CpaB